MKFCINWPNFWSYVYTAGIILCFWTAVVLSVGLVVSCATRQASPAAVELTAPPVPGFTAASDRIKAALDARSDAVAKGDRMAQLQAEKDGLSAMLADVQHNLAVKTREITAERNAQWQGRLYWFVGICGFLGLLAAGVAIFLPVAKTWALRFGVACWSLSALALFAAWLVPYLIWAGVALAVLGVGAVLVWWFRDHTVARQVLTAVESVKQDVPHFKERFRAVIDKGADKRIDQLRRRYHIGNPDASKGDDLEPTTDLHQVPISAMEGGTPSTSPMQQDPELTFRGEAFPPDMLEKVLVQKSNREQDHG